MRCFHLVGLSVCLSLSELAAGGEAAGASERKYLLERIDDAAVVQLYADGLEQRVARVPELPGVRQLAAVRPVHDAGRNTLVRGGRDGDLPGPNIAPPISAATVRPGARVSRGGRRRRRT